MPDKHCDVFIVGGGITGTALLYVLTRYTDIKRIILAEKYDSLAKHSKQRQIGVTKPR